MLRALEQFNDNVMRVKGFSGLTRAVVSLTTSAIDASDMLRAQYVFAVSALDLYVHEITRLGMLEVFDGARVAPPGYFRFRISLDCVGAGLLVSRGDFDAEIRVQHGYLAFQQPDKISEAIRLFKEIKLWESVGNRLGISAGDVKERLKLIVDRRNKIAHEADVDPTYPKARWPISASDVDGVVAFLNEVVHAIHAEVA